MHITCSSLQGACVHDVHITYIDVQTWPMYSNTGERHTKTDNYVLPLSSTTCCRPHRPRVVTAGLISHKVQVKGKSTCYSLGSTSQTLSLTVQFPPTLVIGPFHSDATSAPRGAYSPAAQEVTTIHRDSITFQPGTHFYPCVRRSNAGKMSYAQRTQRTVCPRGESNPGPSCFEICRSTH